MFAGVQETLTDVMVGEIGGALPPLPPLPPQPATHNDPRNVRATKILHVIVASFMPDCPGKFGRQKCILGSAQVNHSKVAGSARQCRLTACVICACGGLLFDRGQFESW
jgi:hypothetical protein